MKAKRSLAAILLLAATGSLAQPGEKPQIEISEPTRWPSPERKQAFTITIVEYALASPARDTFPQAIPELISFFQNATDVQASLSYNKLQLSDVRIAHASMLYMTGNDATLQIGDQEKANLGEYLKKGGLLFADDVRHPSPRGGFWRSRAGRAGTPFDLQFKLLMSDPAVLGSQGQHWQEISRDHLLYRSYFELPNGPPQSGVPSGSLTELEMLEMRGRPVVIFSDLNISYSWGTPTAEARESGLRFGSNLVVYAMTRQAMNWR